MDPLMTTGIITAITTILRNSVDDNSMLQQYINEENVTKLIEFLKETLDDDYNAYNSTLLAIQSNELDKLKIDIDNAKSLYYEGLDNPELLTKKLDSAHEKLINVINSLNNRVRTSVSQLRQNKANFKPNAIFPQKGLGAEIDHNIAHLTRAMHLFSYTIELDYAINSVLCYNVERSFNAPGREMIKYLEDEKVHRLVLSLCADEGEIYDFWYHIDGNLGLFLKPPTDLKKIRMNENEQKSTN